MNQQHPQGPAGADRDEPASGAFVVRHRFVDPGLVYEPPRPRARWDLSLFRDLGLVLFVVAAAGAGLVTWNAVGDAARAAFAPLVAMASASPSASAPGSPLPSPSGGIAVLPSPSPTPPLTGPSPTPSTKPKPSPVDVNVVAKPRAVFVSEAEKTWCAAAAIQVALNANAREPDTSRARQARIHELAVKLTDRTDSRNGGTGPEGMVAALNQLGSVDYELKVYGTRQAALLGAARAISRTGSPAILLAWRGAHAWVMAGYRATADPVAFKDARIKGAYILDPWYPRVSSTWGRSDPPGAYQDSSEMVRNFRPWHRPEGRYPGRDGRFLVIVPVAP